MSPIQSKDIYFSITITCLYNILRILMAVKMSFQLKCFNYFLIFAKNIKCGYTLEMSNHNLCFRAKIRNNVNPCKPQFYYIKLECKGSTLHELARMMTFLSSAHTLRM